MMRKAAAAHRAVAKKSLEIRFVDLQLVVKQKR
jgi:hypothetical protein